MEALKAQIQARKRQATDGNELSSKYIRRGELRARTETKHTVETEARPPTSPVTRVLNSESDEQPELFSIPDEDTIQRLRQRREPIKLFGETEKDRRLRLRAIELIEEHGGDPHGRNDSAKLMQKAEEFDRRDVDKQSPSSNKQNASGNQDFDASVEDAKPLNSKTSADQREGVGMNSLLDLELIRKDTGRVYPIIYYTLKGLLNEWGESLAQRPDETKFSAQGRALTATHIQTREYLKPLFKGLRRRVSGNPTEADNQQVAPDVLMRIAEIVHHMQQREYRMANDSYLQLSIGNAPWPIGVTAVGIHERSGQEKLYTTNVAHVLNDEESRKYIQSLKRLMTFAQTKYPPEDISKLMG
ncbi:hypothetical protein MPSI1_000017 [Malassezia psittaci]|uniref:Pre-mRNA-splicing factor 18 n=1 Tax=Malassezia psittaci TaxID=1821823 RepID=A0AAF0F5V3_9BASI|nr:hypothetical protein MPSI1_000017 [Malassezia psittaci]